MLCFRTWLSCGLPAEHLCFIHQLVFGVRITEEIKFTSWIRFDRLTQMFAVNIYVVFCVFYDALEYMYPILYLKQFFICVALLRVRAHFVQHVFSVQEIMPAVSASKTQGILPPYWTSCLYYAQKNVNGFICACLHFSLQNFLKISCWSMWFVFALVSRTVILLS